MKDDVVPINATSQDIGLEMTRGMKSVLKRHTSVPINVSYQYMNPRDNQHTMSLPIYQYLKDLNVDVSVKDCSKVAKIEISGIDGVKAGDALVMVEYGVDQNGIVEIRAWNRKKIKNEQ